MTHKPATHRVTERQVGRLPSGTEITVTVHRYEGGSGPTLYVQAAQHGIELNGPAVLRRLHESLTDAHIAGTLVSVPLVNPLAFDHRTYATPSMFDVRNPNLNRVWPGDDDGSLQEQFAARMWELVTEADAVVDLHTGTADMLEHVRFREGERARRLASVFGTTVLLTDEDEGDASSGKFRAAAAREGIPAVTAELANSRQVAEAAIQTGLTGIQNVLCELDILEGAPANPPDQTLLYDDADPVRATESGLFELRPDISVGDHLTAGTEIGTLYSPSTFEHRQTVTTQTEGVAYSLAREGTVIAGERLAALGTPA